MRAYERQVGDHLAAHRPYWTRTLGIESGTFSNIEQGLAWMATLGNSSLGAGCVQLQGATLHALGPVRGEWEVVPWRVGTDVVGHSAVLVRRPGEPPESGYVFDPWLTQTPRVYTYAQWARRVAHFGKIKAAHPQW